MRASVALIVLLSTLGSSCSGPDGSRLQDSPSIAERRLYGSTVGDGASNLFGSAPPRTVLRWDDDPTLKGIGRIQAPLPTEPPRMLPEDPLPSSLQEPWYSFPSPAPLWSAGLPGLPNSGLFGGIPPQFR